jgi:ankyrin repeat protein
MLLIPLRAQYGRTALHDASVNDHLQVVKLLLQRGADVRVMNQFGDTALHEAARWGHLEVVRLLLDNQADISMTNQHGWTPLHFSAAYSQLEVARVLLEAGADVQAKDNVRVPSASPRAAVLTPSPFNSGGACRCTSRPATTTWTWPAC